MATETLGVAALAAELGIEEGATRIKLRKINHPRAGRSYEFKNKAEVRELAQKLRSKPEKAEKAAPVKKAKKLKEAA